MRPENDDTRPLGAAVGHQEQATWNTEIVAGAADARKRLATLRARLALRGYEVREVNGALVVSRWGLLRVLDSLDELEDFARRVGV